METTRRPVLTLALTAMMAAVIALCSWIAVPAAVPFTLQTFGVCCALLILGGKRGTLAILVYLLLGAVGAPVFASFSGGIGVLLGATGGYLMGFLLMGLLYWLITALLGEKLWVQAAALVLGEAVLYIFGTAWFMTVYTRSTGPVDLAAALGWCVWPFLLPDGIKLALALPVAARVKKLIRF